MLRRGYLRAEKVEYPDGIMCCIWHVFPGVEAGDDKEEMGICWDFPFEQLDDLITMLEELRSAPAESCKND